MRPNPNHQIHTNSYLNTYAISCEENRKNERPTNNSTSTIQRTSQNQQQRNNLIHQRIKTSTHIKPHDINLHIRPTRLVHRNGNDNTQRRPKLPKRKNPQLPKNVQNPNHPRRNQSNNVANHTQRRRRKLQMVQPKRNNQKMLLHSTTSSTPVNRQPNRIYPNRLHTNQSR